MDFPELITLFAKNSVATIGTVQAYRELCDKHVGDHIFEDQRLAVEEAKTAIEALMDKQKTFRAQIFQALRRLYAQKTEHFELYRALIRDGYAFRWQAAQLAYFEDEAERIKANAYDAFISFTTRSPAAGDKVINRRYYYFIKAVIGPDYVTPEDMRKRNLLARAFYNLLKDESLEGFYYPNYEGNSAEVLKELEEKLRESRVLCTIRGKRRFQATGSRSELLRV